MDGSLADTLNKLTLQPITEAPSVPSEIVQHILSFLPVDDPTTLTTLLNCQLVSRSFSAASLAPVVWRSLVKERWSYGQLSYPVIKMPMEEDQKLVDELFPGGQGPEDPFAVFRARTRLDGLVRRHIDSLVRTACTRLPPLESIAALEAQTWDELDRYGPAECPEKWTRYYWCSEARILSRRYRAVQIWRDIADKKLDAAQATELGMCALAGFLTETDWEEDLDMLVKIALSRLRGSALEEACADGGSPKALDEVIEVLRDSCTSYGVWTPQLGPSGFGVVASEDFDDWNLIGSMRKSRKLATCGEADTSTPTASALVFNTLLLMLGRRLPPPYTLSGHISTFDHLVLHWAGDATYGVEMAAYNFADRSLHVVAEQGPFVYFPVGGILVPETRNISDSNIDRREPARFDEVELACRLIVHIFLPGVSGKSATGIAELFAEEQASLLSLGLLEHYVLPSLPESERSAELKAAYKKARALVGSVESPNHRPAECPLEYRVGDCIVHRATGTLGVVAGWTKKDLVTRAVPRAQRGGRRGAASKSAPAFKSFQYSYLVTTTLEVPDPPLIVTRAEQISHAQDIADSPLLREQISNKLENAPWTRGKKWESIETAEDGWPLRLVPSAEMRAQWPDG